MTVKERVDVDLKEAMRAKDKLRVETLRSIISQFSYRRIEAGAELSAEDQLEVVRKLVKQRNDSIFEFSKAQRFDLSDKETLERDILLTYLPPQKSEEEIRAVVRETLLTIAPEARSQGALMKILVPKLRGFADGNLIRKLVEEALQAPAHEA